MSFGHVPLPIAPGRTNEAGGGEGVSQLKVKDKGLTTFLDQNPPFELRPEKKGFASKSLFHQWPLFDDKRDRATSERQMPRRRPPQSPCPLKGRSERSKRVGYANFP
jgi:hypothetical protein